MSAVSVTHSGGGLRVQAGGTADQGYEENINESTIQNHSLIGGADPPNLADPGPQCNRAFRGPPQQLRPAGTRPGSHIPHASISTIRLYPARAALTMTRIFVVCTAGSVTCVQTLLLFATLPPDMVTQPDPSLYSMSNAVTPYCVKVIDSVGPAGPSRRFAR